MLRGGFRSFFVVFFVVLALDLREKETQIMFPHLTATLLAFV